MAVVANGNFFLGEIRYKSIYDLVIPLFNQSYDFKIWGRDWENIDQFYTVNKPSPHILQGMVPFSDTPSCYSSAKICISVQTCNQQLSNRTYDILSCGGFLLTSDTQAARQKLQPGVNCVVSKSPAETLHLVEYYLKHQEERIKIAKKGEGLAREKFAYQHTLQEIWPEIQYQYKKHMTRTVNINSNNLLTNGDFRIDPNATWTLYNSFINKSYCHNGSYSVEFLGGENNSYIQQSVAVTPLKSYLIRGAFAKLGSGEGAPVNILVQFYSKESKLLKIGLYASLFASDLEDVREGKWFPYWGYTIEAPENSSYALIIINKISSKNSVPVLGSNFAFKEAEL